ncbi:site-specific tyrosine recombinase XerD [Pseudoclavibacter sp. VKM Ac-2888]|uniref:site-specific tyrosine recombinase XerD n=1 Tax=Pseudoclavibacter sp. VKM Ac-2888 TaxID=2783830 RepID=UPI00188B8E02|nr:site-specific tyrosine recombinase XerD [Pseudoclavibacter sp. VKM Ac-2888]MBF4548625.1 site-specific tyrosine recombinase XerD [Pseudoclavibacter sp. VKM Ac-2888]
MAADPGQATSDAARLDTYLRHLTIERGLSANSLGAYRRDLVKYLDWLEQGDRSPVAAAKPEDVTAFLAHLRDGEQLAASSISRTLSSVRGFHRFLLDEGVLDVDATARVRAPKLPSRLPKALTVAEVERLLQAADGETLEAMRDTALVELLYASGARISELVDLNVDDLLEPGILRVRGKGNKQRIVPVGSFAQRALDRYLVRARRELSSRGSATPALFLGTRGARLSRQSAFNLLDAIAARADLAGRVSPHTLRHTFATHLLEGGADVRVVQELLGHASVSTTQIYTLVTADTLRDVYATSHPRATLGGGQAGDRMQRS